MTGPRHSTIRYACHGGATTPNETKATQPDKGADKFFTVPPSRRSTSWATARLQTRPRKSGRPRPWRGETQAAVGLNGLARSPPADRSTRPSDHSAHHPADCTRMRATRRIPGEPKGRDFTVGSPFADNPCPSIPTDRQSQCSNETETSYCEGLCITSPTAELAGHPSSARPL
jgi:hypothetical protein